MTPTVRCAFLLGIIVATGCARLARCVVDEDCPPGYACGGQFCQPGAGSGSSSAGGGSSSGNGASGSAGASSNASAASSGFVVGLFTVVTSLDGGIPNGPCRSPTLSEDGEVLVFESTASNLVPGDVNGVADVFAYKRSDNAIRLVSVTQDGGQFGYASVHPAVSPDGDVVAFETSNRVLGSATELNVVVVKSLKDERVHLASTWDGGAIMGEHPAVTVPSMTEIVVAFESTASPTRQVYRWSLTDGTRLVGGQPITGGARAPVLSKDGTLALQTPAPLDPADLNGVDDIYVMEDGGARLASRLVDGGAAGAVRPSFSADGRQLVFQSAGLVDLQRPGGGPLEAYALDVIFRSAQRISSAPDGGPALGVRSAVVQSGSATVFAFISPTLNAGSADVAGTADVFAGVLGSGPAAVTINAPGISACGNELAVAQSQGAAVVAFSAAVLPGATCSIVVAR